MKAIPPKPNKGRKGAMVKALLFVVFIVAAIYVVRFTPVKSLLTQEALSHLSSLRGYGPLCFLYLCMRWGYVCLCQGLCSLPWELPSLALTGDFCMSG